MNVAVAERRIAIQVFDGAARITGTPAVRIEIQGRAGANSARCTPVARSRVLTGPIRRSRPDAVRRSDRPASPASEPKSSRVSWPSCASRQSMSSAPASARNSGSAAQAGLQPHHAGVGQVEAHIGSGGLATQPHAPVAGVLLPEGKVGVDERKRQLLRAVLDVDARVGRLKVRQRHGLRCRCVGVAADGARSGKRVQIPAAARCAPGSGWPRPR